MLGWFQALMPREERFFELFRRHAETLVVGAAALRELLDGGPGVADACERIMRHELEADVITREVLLTVRRTLWVIPLMSTIHILAIGMVLSSVIMIDLRVWGVSRSQTLVQSAKRFTPWLWVGMVLLVVSGLGLTISQARRTLLDPSFHIKMVLMM